MLSASLKACARHVRESRRRSAVRRHRHLFLRGLACEALEARRLLAVDFTDLPLMDYGWAGHEISDVWLGVSVDGEDVPFDTPDADGDDLAGTDDEDGVFAADGSAPTNVYIGGPTTLRVNLGGAQGDEQGYLNVWVDYTNDATFSADERVVDNLLLLPGSNPVMFSILSGWVGASVGARFRLTSEPWLGNATGLADSGEVEDYRVMTKYSCHASASGVVYEDLNGNGVLEDGEPGLSGWIVGLDRDGDNVADDTVATGPDGRFDFSDLSPGTYAISVDPQLGWTATAPADGIQTATLGSGDAVGDLNFGNAEACSIKGYKFEDVNGNGVDDAEPPMEGVTVTLTGTDGMGNPVGPLATQTGPDGAYGFSNLMPGTYTVSETVPGGSVSTTPSPNDLTLTSGQHRVAAASQAKLTIPVFCGSQRVGEIVAEAGRGGMKAKFKSSVGAPPSLDAAAAACGEDHFNWHQIVTADNHPPKDADGNRLEPPYNDPPPGGYGTYHWADSFPWYWNEGEDPPQGTPGFKEGYHRDDHQADTDTPPDGADETLHFEDFPVGSSGLNLSFTTLLVSLNQDNSFHSYRYGFDWDWSNSTGTEIASAPRPNLTERLDDGTAGTPTLGVKLPHQLFGDLPNRDDCCHATSTIRSFQFLKNLYSDIYGGTNLLPGAGTDLPSARDKLDGGWADSNGMGGCEGGATPQSIWEAKVQWIEDFAPDTTDIKGMVDEEDTENWWNGAEKQRPEEGRPTWDFLWTELTHGENVEIGFSVGGKTHMVTLTSLKFDDANGNGRFDKRESGSRKIGYLDPHNPGEPKEADLGSGADGSLLFFWDDDETDDKPAQMVLITFAYSESPKPKEDIELRLGNAVKGEIHGYNFKDENGNGVDDGEPRLVNVSVTLSGVDGLGQSVTQTTVTGPDGQFAFTGLSPSMAYTVAQTPSEGLTPTTPTEFTVPLLSRQALVAHAGQANLPPDDPRYEVVMGPALIFGNELSSTIVDNDDPARFSVDGDFRHLRRDTRFVDNDVRYARGGDSTARWTFSTLDTGWHDVAVTGLGGPNLATNAPYRVFVGGELRMEVRVDQNRRMNGFEEAGEKWEKVGTLWLEAGETASLELGTDGTTKYVVADAAWIRESTAPELEVIGDDGPIVSGESVVDLGDVNPASLPQVSRTFTIENRGGVPLHLVEPIAVPAGFHVAESFGATTLQPFESTTFTVALTQATAGTVGGKVSFLSDDQNESPFEFDLIGRVGVQVSDNDNPDFSLGSGTFRFGLHPFYADGGFRYAAAGDGSSYVDYQFTGLTAGQFYSVAATWVGSPFSGATNAPYRIYGGLDPARSDIPLATVRVNQNVAPDDFAADGDTWENLDVVQVPPGETALTVRLSNDASSWVYADAVRVELTDEPEVPNYLIIDDDNDAQDDAFRHVPGSQFLYYPAHLPRADLYFDSDVTYHKRAAWEPVSTVEWVFDGLLPGVYDVSLTWFGSPNRATDVPVGVVDSDGVPLAAPITINQELQPDDFDREGAPWELVFDNVTVLDEGGGTGSLVVQMSDDANEYVIADAAMIEYVGPASMPPPVLPPPAPANAGPQRASIGLTAGERASLSTVEAHVVDAADRLLNWASSNEVSVWVDTDARGLRWKIDRFDASLRDALFPRESDEPTSDGAATDPMDVLTVLARALACPPQPGDGEFHEMGSPMLDAELGLLPGAEGSGVTGQGSVISDQSSVTSDQLFSGSPLSDLDAPLSSGVPNLLSGPGVATLKSPQSATPDFLFALLGDDDNNGTGAGFDEEDEPETSTSADSNGDRIEPWELL